MLRVWATEISSAPAKNANAISRALLRVERKVDNLISFSLGLKQVAVVMQTQLIQLRHNGLVSGFLYMFEAR
jgi:hypothetical protein